MRWYIALLMLASLTALRGAAETEPGQQTTKRGRHFTARQVFDLSQPIIFQDDFRSGLFGKWNFSEDDRYELLRESPERIAILDAPGLNGGRKAVRFAVQRAPNSFRSEISLPSEKGFNERWYAERMLIPPDWIFDSGKGNDIVMQWHAVPGRGKPTNPNLELSVGRDSWFIRQAFGETLAKKSRTNSRLDEPVQRGVWVTWVIHAKWSPDAAGVLQLWKDGKLVWEHKGTNVYTDIGESYTPYLKTGIYHPEWHVDNDAKRAAFAQEKPAATNKVIYVTDVKVGGEKASLEDMSPGK